MATKTTNLTLNCFTELPLKHLRLADTLTDRIIVQTPHKGVVEIKTKEHLAPSLLGSYTIADRESSKILNQLSQLEKESKDYLFKQWKKSICQ